MNTPPRRAARGRSSQAHDHAIARRAAAQHGLVTRAQLAEAGLNADAIAYKLTVGRLHLVHPRVYAVGHRPPSPLARAMAAVLACGRRSVLSHRSAAALWGLDPRWRVPVEVSAPSQHRVAGVLVHRSRTLTRREVTINFGIPVTTVARTLLDLADVLDDRALARAINDAQLKQRLRLDDLGALLADSPGRNTARLKPFVEGACGPTRSVFEDAFLAFVDEYELPRPEVNETIAGHEVDMLWREQRLIVELDSRDYHDAGQPFERDRDRDAELLAAGYPVVRITWRRFTDAPAREARRLAELLASGPQRGHA